MTEIKWTIPGTVLVAPREEAQFIENQFSAMFLGGGVALSQITAVTGLETHAVQNWVKRGFLSPPVKKRYDLEQFCRISLVSSAPQAARLRTITKASSRAKIFFI